MFCSDCDLRFFVQVCQKCTILCERSDPENGFESKGIRPKKMTWDEIRKEFTGVGERERVLDDGRRSTSIILQHDSEI